MRYEMEIDGGQGGTDACEAANIGAAMVTALAWAADGDWSEAQEDTEDQHGGTGATVSVRVWREDDDGEVIEEAEEDYEIPTLGDLIEAEVDDGEVVAEDEGEYDTLQIVRVNQDYYVRRANGGARGAWDRQCGDGVWRDRPVEAARAITREEARARMLDMGMTPREVARATR